MTERRVCMIDSETTGLGPDRQIWEFAVVAEGFEQVWVVTDVDMRGADPKSLAMNGFYERHDTTQGISAGSVRYSSEEHVAGELWEMLNGCTVVAAIPEFDLVPLAAMLRRHGLEPSWHYRTRCAEALTVGYLGTDPGGLIQCMAALEIDYPEADRHSALGDARAVARIWAEIGPGGRRR